MNDANPPQPATSNLALTRRLVVGASLSIALAPSLSHARSGASSDLVHIGMNGSQIHAARFDAATGALTPLGPVAEGLRPTWAVQHPRLPVLYYTDEAGNDGTSEGGVVAYRVDAATGGLTRLGDLRAGGGGTTHLSLDPRTSTILAANYGGGSVAALSLRPAGELGALTGAERSAGSGPHRRQASPHPHSTLVEPSRRFVLVPDLGADRVFIVPFDKATGRLGALDPTAEHHYVAPAGSGPRHLAAHRNGRVLYLMNELTADIHVLAWDKRAGRLSLRQVLSINEDGFAGQSSGGAIGTSPDGRFLYASNRGDSSLVVHAVDRRTGRLARIQKLLSGGDKPWHFTIHPSGKWMLVANRDANAISVFSVHPRSGRLTDAGQTLATPAPLHVHVLRR